MGLNRFTKLYQRQKNKEQKKGGFSHEKHENGSKNQSDFNCYSGYWTGRTVVCGKQIDDKGYGRVYYSAA